MALISALWLSLILSLLAISIILSGRNSALTMSSMLKSQRAYMTAESAANIGIFKVASRAQPWTNEEQSLEIDGIPAQISVTSSKAKLDINLAPPTELARLFRLLGYEADMSETMAYQMADWRDVDALTRIGGGEADLYAAAGQPGPQNRNFRSVSELGAVLSIGEATVICLEPFVTIYSGASDVTTLARLGTLNSIPNMPDITSSAQIFERRGTLAGAVFDITAKTKYSSSTDVVYTKTVRFTGRANDPVWVHGITKGFSPAGKSGAVLPITCPVSEGSENE